MTDQGHIRRYSLKLYPTKPQVEALELQCALSARLWNAALEQREQHYHSQSFFNGECGFKKISYYDQAKEIKFLRKELPEYQALSASSMELVLRSLDDAFSAFFRRLGKKIGTNAGYPKYKSAYRDNVNRHATIWHREHLSGWRLMPGKGKNFTVYLFGVTPKLKKKNGEVVNLNQQIKARGKFPVALDQIDLRDCRIIRNGDTWEISIAVKLNASRAAGEHETTVDFSRIDDFAIVNQAKNRPFGSDETCSLEGKKRELQTKSVPCVKVGVTDPDFEGKAKGTRVGAFNRKRITDPDFEGKAKEVLTRPVNPLRVADPDFLGNSMLQSIKATQQKIDQLLSECDTKHQRFSYRWKKKRRQIAKLQPRLARQRKHFLHVLTTQLVRDSSSIKAIIPDIGETVKTGKGNEARHGAAVKTTAIFNRHVLAKGAGMAAQMLEYKGSAANIPVLVVKTDEGEMALGQDLHNTAKAIRQANRKLKQKGNNPNDIQSANA